MTDDQEYAEERAMAYSNIIHDLRAENARLLDLLDNALGWLGDKKQDKPLMSVDSIRAARAAMGESDE